MLNKLHEEINKIVPIKGVSIIGVDQYSIDYEIEPTAEQINQVNDVLENWPLTLAKIEKYNEVESWWDNSINNGWQTPSGWRLGISNQDVTLLTGAFILAKEASSLGITNPITVVDLEGTSHQFDLAEFTTLMLQYGNYRSNLSQEYATKKLNIKNASSVSDLLNL